MALVSHMDVRCSGNNRGRTVLYSGESRRTQPRSRYLSLTCRWAWHTLPLAYGTKVSHPNK